MISIPIEIGDIVRVGRFKNKRIKVKTIEYDEYGLPIINGRPLLTMRIEKLMEPKSESIIKLKDILSEADIQYTSWVKPSSASLKKEFDIEQVKKGNEFWEDEEAFLNAISKAKVITVTPAADSSIEYRSHTRSFKELLSLIKSYRSYPKYRNEDTLKGLYDRFKQNETMDMPVVIQFSDGTKRIFSGNTRMDIAFQLGINPKVLLVKAK